LMVVHRHDPNDVLLEGIHSIAPIRPVENQISGDCFRQTGPAYRNGGDLWIPQKG
jgi:hypothetical protein